MATDSVGRRLTLSRHGILLLTVVVAALGSNLRALVHETQLPMTKEDKHGWLPVDALDERRSAGDLGGQPAHGNNSTLSIRSDKNGLLNPPALEVPSPPSRTANVTSYASQAQVARSILDLNSSATKVGNKSSGASVAVVSDEIRTNSTAATTAAFESAPLQGTAVVQLSGELGNHLQVLAHYFAVQVIALEEFNLNLTLHVRKQNARKAKSAAENTVSVFDYACVQALLL